MVRSPDVLSARRHDIMSELIPDDESLLPVRAVTPARARLALPPDDAGSGAEPIDLKESLGVLRRHIWLVLSIAGIAVLFTAYRLHKDQRQYQAGATIRLVDTQRELAGNLDNSSPYQTMGAWTDPIESQMQVLRSRAVGEAVADSQPLGTRVQVAGFPAALIRNVSLVRDNPGDSVKLTFNDRNVLVESDGRTRTVPYGSATEAGGVRFTVAGAPAKRDAGMLRTISRSAATDMVLGGLHASQRTRTDVVDVSYTAPDPYVAQQVVNAAVKVFQEENAERAQQQSRRRRIFLESQLDQTDSLLRVAQDHLSQYRSTKRVYGSADAVVAAEQTGLLNLESQRQDMVASRRVYQSLLQQLSGQTGDPRGNTLSALVASPGIADNPVVQATYQQLVTYQATLDSATTGRWSSAPTNPDVQRLHKLIAGSQAQLTDAVQSQVTSLDARIQALDELRDRNSAALKKLPATQAGEARLLEQVESTRNMADQLRSEYQKARVAEAVEAGQVEIVDLARQPFAPIGTSRRIKLLTGLIVGLLLGAGAAFLVERLNTGIRRREEIESVLQIPDLGIIPRITSSANAGRRLAVGRMSFPLPNRIVGHSRRSNGTSLVTVSDGRSGSSEAFRTLRTNLIFSQAVQTLRVMVVTSPSPQDGKTTTVANLAVTFAQQGMRVVIVDCDLRRARLHTLFRTSREPGLTQLLLGQAAEGDVMRQTFVDGLSFISAGTLPPNPSELLGGTRMHDLIVSLASQFEVVLLDTPPVHAAADSLILGKMSDGVLLVLRAGHTERASALDAIHRLTSIGVRVVGAVLNDPDHKVPQYSGYYYYDYSGPETA
ncbi:MAG: polysaccharide biosynthesis tyrosine autokinase [Gemmatimonadaceae bacterium]